MPYTPPSSHTPAGSKLHTPTLSRSLPCNKQEQQGHNASQLTSKPEPPRSATSSRDYLQKHRRSPSISQSPSSAPLPPTRDGTAQYKSAHNGGDGKPTVLGNEKPRPASPERARGTMISSPDSSQNSSEDEASERWGRRRDLDNMAELQAAIRIIEQHRGSSPNREAAKETKQGRMTLGLPAPRLEALGTSKPFSPRPPLSAEARKISHSRSNTDASVFDSYPRNKFDSPSLSISDNDFEEVPEAEISEKPALVRKKSGEPVRPALRPSCARRRPSSMPGTPTYSKAVHFNNDLEQVRHFLQVDRPLAVSAGSSPVEHYENELEFPFGNSHPSNQTLPFDWEIRLTNFPRETAGRSSMPVKVERVYLSSDNKQLLGAINVRNISFHKLVVARFTLDYWKTTSEVKADFSNDVRRKQLSDGYDRFVFGIKLEDLANLENKTMFFCVRYNVAGQEFWDNNGSMNYQVDFSKKAKPQLGKHGMQGANSRPLNALPRSKPTSPRPRSFPSKASDDFASSLASPYEFSSFPQPSAQIIGDSPIRFKKPAPELVPDAPGRRTTAAGQAFGNRYDFGASLSAAIQAASSVLGDRSGIQVKEGAQSAPAKQLQFSPEASFEPAMAEVVPGQKDSLQVSPMHLTQDATQKNVPGASDPAKPIALTTEKPSVQSSSYHELLDKYCFFGSGKPSAQPNQAHRVRMHNQDRSERKYDNKIGNSTDSEDNSPHTSGASSPSPPRLYSPPLEEDSSFSKRSSSRESHSASPATGSGLGSRTASPVSFGYPYHQPIENAFFGDTNTPTAIHG